MHRHMLNAERVTTKEKEKHIVGWDTTGCCWAYHGDDGKEVGQVEVYHGPIFSTGDRVGWSTLRLLLTRNGIFLLVHPSMIPRYP
jgi:hypothetical protein